MKLRHRLLLVVPALVLFAGVGAAAYFWSFLRYRGDLEADLTFYSEKIGEFREALDERSTIEQRLHEIAQSTLGFSAEQVDASFRMGLRDLAVDAGLIVDEIVVTPPVVRSVKNPAVEAKISDFRNYAKADFVQTPDLYMVDAEIRGGGTFTAVTRLLALAQSQPWIWSVRGFSLKPRDAQATSFDIRVDVTTAYMPDLAPKPSDADGSPPSENERPPIVDPTAEQVLAAEAIVSRNVFAPPPLKPEPITIATGPGQPGASTGGETLIPPPPPPPYHEWRLTSISSSPSQGVLAWMVNVRTGVGLLVSPGQSVLDATFVDAADERAVFQIGEQQFSLALDETLADRHPIE